MKKLLAVLLALAMILSLGACGAKEEPKPESKVTEVTGVTVPEFKVKICGAKITNETMASYKLYQAVSHSTNSQGNSSENTYVGYKMVDVISAAQISGSWSKAQIICTDGYESTYEGDIQAEDVLLAITKNGESFKDGPWFAPCSSEVSGDFAQDLSKIELDGITSPLAGGGDSKDGEKSETADIPFPQDPVSEDKTDKITFADFSFKINGKEVTNKDLEGLKIFRNTVVTKNSKDVVSESKYSGYVLKDVLAKLGISGSKVTAIASDGYTSELDPALVDNDLTIIAIEKDKQTGEGGTVWLAPCSENKSGAYAKGVIEITVE